MDNLNKKYKLGIELGLATMHDEGHPEFKKQ